MGIVRESINFERGADPKKTMDLGLFSIIKKELRNLYRKYLGYDEELGELNNVYDLAGVLDTTPFNIGLPNDDENPLWIYIGYRGNRRNLFEKDIEWAEPYINYKKYWKSPYNDSRDTGYARVKPEYKDIFRNFLDNKNFLEESVNFERGIDPKASMGLGKLKKIQDWMENFNIGVRNYKVNPDYSILTDMDIILTQRKELLHFGRLPEYIQFHTTGSFDVDDCGLVSLEGFPFYVQGYFSCQQNEITSLRGFPQKIEKDCYVMGNEVAFIADEIEQICEVGGQIEADDSDV
jgi:hypothetical protein